MSKAFRLMSPGDSNSVFEVRMLLNGYSFNLTPWPTDSIRIHSEFGREGCYIEATTQINAGNPLPQMKQGQSVLVRIRGMPQITAIIKSMTYACQGDKWRMTLLMEPIVFNAANQHDVRDWSLQGDGQLTAFEIIGKLLKEAGEVMYKDDKSLLEYGELDNSDKSNHFMYDSVHWKYKSVGDIIDCICYESELEYYYGLFPGNSIHVGWPAPPITPDTTGRALIGVFASINNGGRYTPMKYRGTVNGEEKNFDGITCVVSGSPVLCAGMIFNWTPLGIVMKIACAEFYATNEGEAETSLLAIDRMAYPLLTQLAIDMYKDRHHAKWLELDHQTAYGFRVADVKPCDKFYGEKETTATKVEELQQNPVEWKPVEDKTLFPNLVWASPFTGDGVGLLFPKQDANRRLIFFPNHEQHFGIVSDGIWRKDEVKEEVIPERNDDDFLLRLNDGYLYFDAANMEWLLRSENVKLQAKAVDVASTKPDVTETADTWIEIKKDGTITIKGKNVTIDADHIYSGKNAAKNVALKDHKHHQTWFSVAQLAILAGYGITPPFDTLATTTQADSDSNSSKTKAD